jgi:hypothetical protein
MPRPTRTKVKVNNIPSLEVVLQEVYNEACSNIKEAQKTINELTLGSQPEDIDDHTKVAKAKTDLLKEKTSNVKLKLEVARLQNETIKHAGDMAVNMGNHSANEVKAQDFAEIRKLIEARMKEKDEQENE